MTRSREYGSRHNELRSSVEPTFALCRAVLPDDGVHTEIVGDGTESPLRVVAHRFVSTGARTQGLARSRYIARSLVSMTFIDAHQHFWNPERVSYPWLASAYPELDRIVDFDELAPLLNASNVGATVLVQSEDDEADNELMFEIASRHAQIAGIVAWAPLDDPPALNATIDRLSSSDKLVGIRVLIHNRPDPDWIVRQGVQEGLGVLEERGLTFDVVAVAPRHLEHVPAIAERFPNLRLILDHLAKPPIGRDLTTWAEMMTRAAAHPNVFAKVSGLYPALGDRHPWTVDDLRPAFSVALDAFGADRLMFGSDWPICEVAGGYLRVMRALRELAHDLTEDEQSALLGRTAIHCYGLGLT